MYRTNVCERTTHVQSDICIPFCSRLVKFHAYCLREHIQRTQNDTFDICLCFMYRISKHSTIRWCWQCIRLDKTYEIFCLHIRIIIIIGSFRFSKSGPLNSNLSIEMNWNILTTWWYDDEYLDFDDFLSHLRIILLILLPEFEDISFKKILRWCTEPIISLKYKIKQ